MIIRREEIHDYNEVFQLIADAFKDEKYYILLTKIKIINALKNVHGIVEYPKEFYA